MSELNLDEMAGSRVDENGVEVILVGAVINARLRHELRNLLKAADLEGYSLYRDLKYDPESGETSHERGVESTRFLFDRVRDLLSPYYVPSGCESCSTSDDEDCT
jgi:hypothetical protein